MDKNRVVVNTNMYCFGIYCELSVGKNHLENEADESTAQAKYIPTSCSVSRHLFELMEAHGSNSLIKVWINL